MFKSIFAVLLYYQQHRSRILARRFVTPDHKPDREFERSVLVVEPYGIYARRHEAARTCSTWEA